MATTKKALSPKEVAAQAKKKRKNAERKRTWVGAKAPKRKKKVLFNAEELTTMVEDQGGAALPMSRRTSKAPGVTTYVLDHKTAAEALVTGRLK